MQEDGASCPASTTLQSAEMEHRIKQMLLYDSFLVVSEFEYFTEFAIDGMEWCNKNKLDFKKSIVICLIFLLCSIIFSAEGTSYRCPNGFSQHYILLLYPNTNVLPSTCKICDQSLYTCSGGDYWNNGEITFSNPIQSSNKLYSMHGTIYYQFDKCKLNEVSQTGNMTISLDSYEMTDTQLVSGGCTCGGCSQFSFLSRKYDILNQITQNPTSIFKPNYVGAGANICITEILLNYCYVSKNVNITNYSITSRNGTDWNIDLTLGPKEIYFFDFQVANNGPDSSSSLNFDFQFSSLSNITLQNISIIFPYSSNSLSNSTCTYSNEFLNCPIYTTNCVRNNLVYTCSLDYIVIDSVYDENSNSTIHTTFAPSYSRNFFLRMFFAVGESGVTTTLSYSLVPSRTSQSVDTSTSLSGSLSLNIFSNSITRKLTLGSNIVDRISPNSLDTYKFTITILESNVNSFSNPILMINYLFSERIGFNIKISCNGQDLYTRRVLPEELITVSTQYQYTLSIPYFTSKFEISTTNTISIILSSFTQISDTISYTVYSKITNMINTALNSDQIVDSDLQLYQWRYYFVTSYSDSAILNILFETTDIYASSVNILISSAPISSSLTPNYPYDWQMTKLPSPSYFTLPSSIKLDTEKKNAWLYKDVSNTKQAYYVAVYGKLCPFKCYYKVRSYLTDDERILLQNGNTKYSVTYTKKEPNTIYYSTKLKIEKANNSTKFLGNLLRYSFKLLDSVPITSIEVYIRKSLFPSTQLYDFKQTGDCYDLSGHIQLDNTIYDYEWYFGFIYRVSPKDDTEYLSSIKVDFWIDTPLIFSDTIDSKVSSVNFDLLSTGAKILSSDYAPPYHIIHTSIVLLRNTSNIPLIFYSKVGEAPYVDDYHTSFGNTFHLPNASISTDIMLTLNYVASINNGGTHIIYRREPFGVTELFGYENITMDFVDEGNLVADDKSNLLMTIPQYNSYTNSLERIIYQSIYEGNTTQYGCNSTSIDVTIVSHNSFPSAVSLTTRYDGINPILLIGTNNSTSKNDSKSQILEISTTSSTLTTMKKRYIPYFFSFDLDEIMRAFYKNFSEKTSDSDTLIKNTVLNPNDYLSTTQFRIETTFWDITNLSDFDRLSLTCAFEKLSVENVDEAIPKDSKLEKEVYKYSRSSSTSASLYMVKYSLTFSLSAIHNYSSYNNISGFLTSQKTTNNSLYLTVWNQDENYHHEIISFIVSDGKISNELTFLPFTTYALISITALVCFVVFLLMIGFSCKFYEKIKKRKLTTFETLRDNDPFCFGLSLWFSLFGSRTKSRRARQLQILIPALLLLFIAVISVVTFLVLSLSYSDHLVCCSQAGDVIYQFNQKNYVPQTSEYSAEFDRHGLYTLGSASTKCFISSNFYDISQVQQGRKRIIPKPFFVIPILDKPSKGINNAVILCPRSEFKSVIIRGSDIFGMVGTLLCGTLILLSFSLFSILFIEIVLSSWFVETVLFPKLSYRIINE